jgi:UDP-N-acetyl-D-glucosamine dehydrogenase
MLQERGSTVCYHDPYVPKTMEMRAHNLRMQSVELSDDLLESVDAVVISTDHSNIDYSRVVRLAPLVIDTRNATANVSEFREKIIKA